MQSERLRWRDVRTTTPFRLTLLLGTLFLVGLWATLALSWYLTEQELTARSDRILFARADVLLHASPEALPALVRTEIAEATPGLSYFGLESRSGELVVGNLSLETHQPFGRPFDLTSNQGLQNPMRALQVRTRSGEILVLGRDVSQIHSLRARLLTILLVSGVLGTILVLASALVLSIPRLRRVHDLGQASRAIAAGDFARRMPIAGRRDELDQFAVTVNLMVEEVGHVVAQVKIATDAIAHDLRTPLTRVRTSLHRARQSDSELPPQHRAIVDEAVADLDRILERFGALLRISELEAGIRRSGLRRFTLNALLEEIIELYEPLAEERGVALALEAFENPDIEADRELLFEALSNIIDNATKFAASRVLLRATTEAGIAILDVVDDGPGIASDEHEAVRLRFHRARGAAGAEGTGLGLAVVTAIVRMHGFGLEFVDADPGLIARVRLGPEYPR